MNCRTFSQNLRTRRKSHLNHIIFDPQKRKFLVCRQGILTDRPLNLRPGVFQLSEPTRNPRVCFGLCCEKLIDESVQTVRH